MVHRVFTNCPWASIKKHHYDLFSTIKEEAFSENNPVRPQQSQFNMQQTMRWMEGDDGMSFLSDLLNQISI